MTTDKPGQISLIETSRAALPFHIMSIQCGFKEIQRDIDIGRSRIDTKEILREQLLREMDASLGSFVDKDAGLGPFDNLLEDSGWGALLEAKVTSEDVWREVNALLEARLREIEKEVCAAEVDLESPSALSLKGAFKAAVDEMTSKEEELIGNLWDLLCKRMKLFVLFGWANLWDFGSESFKKTSMVDSYSEELKNILGDDFVVLYPEAQVAAALAAKWNVLVWDQNRADSEGRLRQMTLGAQEAVEKKFPRDTPGTLRDFVYADPFTDKEELPSDALLRKYDMVQGLGSTTAVECFKVFEQLPPLILKWMAQTIKEEILGKLGTND